MSRNSPSKIFDYEDGLLLSEGSSGLDVVEQRTALDLLEHEVEHGGLLEVLEQLQQHVILPYFHYMVVTK